MSKIPRLSDRELNKWIGILGVEKIKMLYVESKIYLTPSQLDGVIVNKSEERKPTKVVEAPIKIEEKREIPVNDIFERFEKIGGTR